MAAPRHRDRPGEGLIGGVQLAVKAVDGRGAGMRTRTGALDRTDRSASGFWSFMCVGMSRGVFVAVQTQGVNKVVHSVGVALLYAGFRVKSLLGDPEGA